MERLCWREDTEDTLCGGEIKPLGISSKRVKISSNLVRLGFFFCHQLKGCQLVLFNRGVPEAPDTFVCERKGKRQLEPLGHDINGSLMK